MTTPKKRGRKPLGDRAMPVAERWAKWARQQERQGGRRINVWISGPAAEVLDALVERFGTESAALNELLLGREDGSALTEA